MTGVYPRSYFNLELFQTHWKLVGLVFLKSTAGGRSRQRRRLLDWINGRELQDTRTDLSERSEEDSIRRMYFPLFVLRTCQFGQSNRSLQQTANFVGAEASKARVFWIHLCVQYHGNAEWFEITK